jgi:hypothetical protein
MDPEAADQVVILVEDDDWADCWRPITQAEIDEEALRWN